MSVATISQNSVVDAANSSVVALGAAGTFTGRGEDVSIYASVGLFVFSDQAGTLFIDFSVDGQNWDKSQSFAVVASTANAQSVAPQAQFARVRYTNGATPQTTFRLQTFYQPIAPAAASSIMGTVTANQGTAAGLAGYWPVRVTDGVNTMPTGDVVGRALFQTITDGTNTAAVTAASALKVDGSAVTQPVSAASLPLPTGAATAANQTTLGSQTTKINDGTTTVAVTLANALKTDGSAVTQPVSAAALPLPTGAATEATLATRLADATFTARINTLGQKTMAASTPIVIASDQSAVPVSGTVTANIGTSGALALDATLTGGTQKTRITDGTNDASVSAANALKVDGSAVTQPVSAASLPLPTGAATSANQTTLGAQTTKLNDGTNTAAVTAASALKVDGSAVTQPISAASLPLPAGAAQEHVTAASPHAVRLTDGAAFYDATKTGQLPSALVGGRLDTNVGAWLGSTAPTVGQKTAANSLPTILASDQGALPINVVGAHANAWNAVAVAANGVSAAIDCQYVKHISVFGNTSGNTTITIQESQDNTNFYDTDSLIIGGGGGNFGIKVTSGARYIQLKSSQARTITATIAGKG